MKLLRGLIPLVGFLLPACAVAQQFPVVPDHTVIGRAGSGSSSGPSQALPWSTLLANIVGAQSANTVYAGPSSGSANAPTFRALVGADLPAPGASSFGGVQSLTCSSHNWFNSLGTNGVFGCTQPNFTDLAGSIAGTQIPASTITNSMLANAAAWTIKANNSSSSAAPTDVTIDGLTLKGSPTTSDEVPIWDAATSSMKKSTLAAVAALATAGTTPVLVGTITASNSTTLNDSTACGGSNCLTSTYPAYEIIFENIVPATASQTLELQVHSGGSYQATGYIASTLSNAGSVTIGSSQPTTFIQLSVATQMTNAVPGLSGKIMVYGPSTSSIHMWEGKFAHSDSTVVANVITSGFWNTSGVIDGFQVLMSSGNITSGVIKIYGIP